MSTTYNDCSDFWNRYPCNARHGDRAQTDAEYFAQVRAKKYRAEPHLYPFMEPMAWKNKTVLDVGCGIGTQSVWFAQAGAEVTSTDFSEISLDMTIRHTLAAGIADRVVTRHVDYDEGWVPRVPYDLIWAWGTLHHMKQPTRILRLLADRCTRPSTTLKMMVYHKHSTKVLRLMLRHGSRWREFTEANAPVPVSDAYSLERARALVELSGWKVKSARVAHIFPWSVKHYIRGEFVRGFPWNVVPDSMFKKLERKWGFHLLIEARPK